MWRRHAAAAARLDFMSPDTTAAAAAPAAATRHTTTRNTVITKSDAAVNIKETTAKLIEAGVIFNGTKPAM